MKIRTIVDFNGIPKGTIKDVPNNIAENLISRELAEPSEEKAIEDMKLPELKQIAKDKGLDDSGNKSELIDRIKKHQEQ